jgi:GDPmannose 4,6-dehydratase
MLQQKKPQDYIIGTGKSYSIKDFIDEAVKYCDFETLWVGKGLNKRLIKKDTKEIVIKINPRFYRPTEIHFLKCNFNNSRKILKWKPKTDFKNLVKIMMLSDLQKE